MRLSVSADGRTPRWATRLLGVVGRRPLDRVGRGTILAGHPYVLNDGTIEIGEDSHISSHPVRAHMLAMPGARITIGDRVMISYGAGLSAFAGITIGDDTRIGPFCAIMDNDFHTVGDRDSPGLAGAVTIGRSVSIGARVTVLRGTHIGDGASIMSGSTVFGIVREGGVVGGIPAKTLRKESETRMDPRVTPVIKRVFGLSSLPSPHFKISEVRGWTPLGWVRLLLALEEVVGVTLPEAEMCEAIDVAAVGQLVAQTLAGKTPALPATRP